MAKSITKIMLILLLLAGVAGGAYIYFQKNGQQPAGQLQLYGNVDIRQIQLAFQESGRLLKLTVEEGDRVKAGTLLAEIDKVRYQANLDKAKAELAALQQILKRMQSGSRPQEIAKAQANVRIMEAKFTDSEITFHRSERLAKKKVVSQQQLDDATAAYQAAKESLEATRQELDIASTGPRKEDIAASLAKVQGAEAAVMLAQKGIEDTQLFAPVDAVIRSRIMEPGEMVFPNTPVLTLALASPVWVRSYLPEADLGKVRPGMKVSIFTDSFPKKTYDGWVGFISPTAEFTPKTVETPALRTRLVYQTRIFACNPENELRLGMPATIQIDLTQSVSNEAVIDKSLCQEQ